jgi:hypothetical protein
VPIDADKDRAKKNIDECGDRFWLSIVQKEDGGWRANGHWPDSLEAVGVIEDFKFFVLRSNDHGFS